MNAPLTVVVVVVALAAAPAQELRLHSLFADHMVLPAGSQVALRGHADAGVAVTVEAQWLAEPARATATAAGAFLVSLTTPANAAAGEITVRTDRGAVRVLRDVVVGDVWLALGQSNMTMPLGPGPWSDGTEDWQRVAAAANLPNVRCFRVRPRAAATPLGDDGQLGEWEVASPATVADWSAVAFYFAKALQQARQQPVGVVVTSWPGTVCEAWMSAAGLADFPDFAPALARLEAEANTDPEVARSAFWQRAMRGSEPDGQPPTAPGLDDGDWETATLPGRWSRGSFRQHDGIAWYRRTVTLPPSWRARELLLQLGPIDDRDIVFADGIEIGRTDMPGHHDEPRQYVVPAHAHPRSELTLAVCVLDTGGEGGFAGTAESMRLSLADGGDGGVDLSGPWRCRLGPALAALPPIPQSLDERPNEPSVLWNGMVAPLLPFPFRGAIWYQGESNRERAAQYSRLFPAAIRSLRAATSIELPFLFVQIAPYAYGGDRGELFQLRLAQEAALGLPRCAMVASSDCGDPSAIHPLRKAPIGERLAGAAMAVAYGATGDDATLLRPATAHRQAATVRVVFAPTAGGLRTDGSPPAHFELAGADGVFHAATAKLDGDAVILSCAEVPQPQQVRYCHAATAMANLWNGCGQPAVPFVVAVLP